MTTDQDDFWGDQANWPTAATPIVRRDPVDSPSTDLPSTDLPSTDLPSTEPSTLGSFDDTPVAPVWDDTWSPAEPVRARGVDPRLFRLGAIAVIITLLVPVVVGFRSGDADDLVTLATAESAAGPETIEDLAPSASAESDASTAIAGDESVTPAESSGDTPVANPAVAGDESSEGDPSAPVATSGSTDDAESTEAPTDETVSAVAAEQLCAIDYEVRSGDFWLRLADGANVDLDELLDANAASTDTPLYPGRSICLPAGSKTPSPPPAASAGSGSGSSAGSSGGSSGSTSAGSSGGSSGGSQPTPTPAPTPAPTSPPTTAAPTTTAPPPPPPPPAPAQVEQIIRSVWPDQLEDHALEIAWRESNYKANVKNYCCYGLFQIYWSVHRGWLKTMGVSSATQLYDAETNARAAYALYQRAGGWGPWGG